jgi:predicted nuclease of predicted toxin-antitoxin system
MPIRFHLDEHVDPAIATGLARRGIDATTTVQAGLLGASDEEHLTFALGEGRVVFTQDDDFLRLAASGRRHAGVVYCKQGGRAIGPIIEFLELIHLCMTAEEMRDHVEFV